MATYKVLQDIEAEDKLFGPFTLKQFIFGGITACIGFIGFQILVVEAPIFLKAPFLIFLLPFFLLFGFLATPITRDQSSDVWLLARLKFLFKPRTRIWNQDGIVELVTITAPKKADPIHLKGYSQDEVRSRLKALANTVDSRGWAVKNVNTNMFASPGYLTESTSDRLIDPSQIPQEVPSYDVQASDDILDPSNNTTAQHLDQMIRDSSNQYRQQISSITTQQLAVSTPVSGQAAASGTPTPVPTANPTVQDEELARKIAEDRKNAEMAKSHMRTLQPSASQQPVTGPTGPPVNQHQAMNETLDNMRQKQVDPAIINLANNDDLNLTTISRQAKKINESGKDGEVVISLH